MPRKKKLEPSSDPSTPSYLKALSPTPDKAQMFHHKGLTLLEVNEPVELEALLLDPRIKPLILTQISDCAALVLPEQHKTLLETLKKAGHTPKVS